MTALGRVRGEPVQQQIGHLVGLLVENPVRDALEDLKAVLADNVVPQARAPFSSRAMSPSLQTNIVGTVTFLPASRMSLSGIARYQFSADVSAPGSAIAFASAFSQC